MINMLTTERLTLELTLKHTQLLIFTLSLLTITNLANATETRRSGIGICHEKDVSPYFNKVGKRHKFATVEECLRSIPNARLPKGITTGQIKQSEKEAKQQGHEYVSLYSRNLYPHWSDPDGDCQNSRAELLIERSTTSVSFTNSRRCTVKSGKWYGAYTDKYYTSAKSVDIDHLVSLKWAHNHGGYTWNKAKREQFANDQDNLLIVKNTVNRAKGAKGPTTWMPPHQPYRCHYLKHYQKIMKKYGLTFTAKEAPIIKRMNKACGI